MRNVRSFFIATLLALLLPACVRAQPQVTIGNAAVELTGPWKFHTGDNMAWADPKFNDSAWGTMDLTPPPRSADPNNGTSGFVPGWTARGYPGYSGYAWYRLRIDVQEDAARGANQPLAISMPAEFDDAYQIYVNGRLVGQFGRFTQHGIVYYDNQPRVFALSDGSRPTGPLTLAIRMWMATTTQLTQHMAGGLHGPPVLGQAGVLHALLRLYWDTVDRTAASDFLEIGIQLLAIAVVFGLFWLDRGELAYLWLGLSCVISLVFVAFLIVVGHTTWVTGNSPVYILFAVLPPVQDGLWLLFWGYWFGLERTPRLVWLYRVAWGVVLLLAAAFATSTTSLTGRVLPVQSAWLSPLTDGLTLLLGAMLVWITYLGIRRSRAEGWMALPAVALVVVVLNGQYLRLLHVRTNFIFFGVGMPLARIATLASLAIITVLMLRRFLQRQQERARIQTELQQARSVQEMLIPRHAAHVPGFVIESVYLPANEVGGDFFQVQPGEDGSLLVVLGDVSGKGLKAAMMVSSIVGGLKQIATREPAEVLAALNRQLIDELSGGFVTCCAALLTRAGELTLANAGHLPPYLNGKEIAVDGALPLGLTAGAEFPVARFDLATGDTLTLLSDGIVEAQDEHGQLFGFGRVNEMLRQPTSAATLAKAAQSYGQEDDITALRIEYAGVREAVSA